MITEPFEYTKEPMVEEGAEVNNTTFGDYCSIGKLSFIENSNFSDFSYTGQFSFVQNVEIGKFSNIAAAVRIGATAHPYERPSLHHFTYRPEMYGLADHQDEEFFEKRLSNIAKVGHDTWFGHGAIVMPGVTIGNGAIIGAGAVVTKDVPPYAMVVGVPAEIKGYRFRDDQIEALERIAWWDWSYETLKTRISDFQQPIDQFIDKYDKKEQ